MSASLLPQLQSLRSEVSLGSSLKKGGQHRRQASIPSSPQVGAPGRLLWAGPLWAALLAAHLRLSPHACAVPPLTGKLAAALAECLHVLKPWLARRCCRHLRVACTRASRAQCRLTPSTSPSGAPRTQELVEAARVHSAELGWWQLPFTSLSDSYARSSWCGGTLHRAGASFSSLQQADSASMACIV